jgi:hypothetical protein
MPFTPTRRTGAPDRRGRRTGGRAGRAVARFLCLSLGAAFLQTGLTPAQALAQTPEGRILTVGPNQAYDTPGAAARAARDGDVVRIAPGDYVDCASWRANDLRIVAPEGGVTVRDRICEDKAIWVVAGDDIVIENVTFRGAALPDSRIGAGIRAEGTNLTIRGSRFVENQLGLLAAPVEDSTLVIEASAFLRNGPSHGVYVNRIARLVVRDSMFRAHRIRHPIKSRALITEVRDNTIEDGETGSSSYLVEAPQGGTVTIAGNLLHKGPHTDNAGIAISIGIEGDLHPSEGLFVTDNVFLNDGPTETVFVRNATRTPAILRGNRLHGDVRPLAGPGEVRP